MQGELGLVCLSSYRLVYVTNIFAVIICFGHVVLLSTMLCSCHSATLSVRVIQGLTR
jgi:hypothetical protein